MKRRNFLGSLPFLAMGSSLWGQGLAPADSRTALCVGISKYQNYPDLPSAVPDAALIANSFSKIGLQTFLLQDPTYEQFLLALVKLRLLSKDSALAVIYVAAHGFMQNGQSHIIPADGEMRAQDAAPSTIPEATLLQAISEKPRQKILFLDTCRHIPIDTLQTAELQQAFTPYRAGTHVTYATQPNAAAFDGENGHSPFANALSQALSVPNLEIPNLARKIRLHVLKTTSGLQVPWEKSSLLLPVILNET